MSNLWGDPVTPAVRALRPRLFPGITKKQHIAPPLKKEGVPTAFLSYLYAIPSGGQMGDWGTGSLSVAYSRSWSSFL